MQSSKTDSIPNTTESLSVIVQAIANNDTGLALNILEQRPEILSEMLLEESIYQKEFIKILNPALLNHENFSFRNYLHTLRKLPRNEMLIQFLKELINIETPKVELTISEFFKNLTHSKKTRTNRPLTLSEKNVIDTRRNWSNVISQMETANAEFDLNEIKQTVIRKLQSLGYKTNTEFIYKKCCDYLKKNTVISMAFDATKFNQKGLGDYQLLNIFETDKHCPDYMIRRNNVEMNLYGKLSIVLKLEFTNNLALRPRYASLILLDRHTTAGSIPTTYGQSFVVFRECVKFNSLYYPYDSFKDYTKSLATYFHMDLLLSQFDSETLEAIAERVTTGKLSKSYHSSSIEWYSGGGYIEVHLPPINIFDPNVIQHIHIDSREYSLNSEEIASIKTKGITITNGNTNPYPQLINEFFEAITKDNVSQVKKLLELYPSLILVCDQTGYELIYLAYSHNSMDTLRLLIEKGEDINSLHCNTGTSILHDAVANKKLTIVEKLLSFKNIDINVKVNHSGIFMNGTTPIFLNTDYKIFELLIKHGADLNQTSKLGFTPLFSWITRDNNDKKKYVSLLIKNGANINYVEKDGNTALITAVQIENDDIVRLLLGQPNININHKNFAGESALFIAVRKANSEIVKTLLMHPNIDRGAKNKDAKTAIDIARDYEHWPIAELLLTFNLPSEQAKISAKHLHLKNMHWIFNQVISNVSFSSIDNFFNQLESDPDVKEPEKMILNFITEELNKVQSSKKKNFFWKAKTEAEKKLELLKNKFERYLATELHYNTFLLRRKARMEG